MSTPLLVAEGKPTRWRIRIRFACIGVVIVVALGTAHLAPPLRGISGPAAYCLLGYLIGPLVMSFVDDWAARRTGRVEFHEDRIVLREELRQQLSWSEVVAFSDGPSDYVQLYKQGQRWGRNQLAVPTPDEKTRTDVLALLDSRGVQRRG